MLQKITIERYRTVSTGNSNNTKKIVGFQKNAYNNKNSYRKNFYNC